jgi:hypothetical protein
MHETIGFLVLSPGNHRAERIDEIGGRESFYKVKT